MVLDFDRFVEQYYEWNARLLGLDTSNENFTMIRVPGAKMSRPVALACGAYEAPNKCTDSGISSDGMHWCMEAIGGNIFSGIACLLGCAHNGDTEDADACEHVCNINYMSLVETAHEEVATLEQTASS